MLGLPESLRHLVVRKFCQARSSGDVIFSDTQLALLRNHKVPTLRYCPALGKKPTSDTISTSTQSPKLTFDPFENPSPELLISAVPRAKPTHNLVLNKYPVISNHFILATKDNKPQTNLLEVDDLKLTYACLQAWEEDGQSLFAFFNSGKHSGASQPHRHVQFLPVEDMAGEERSDWRVLCETMSTPAHKSLPLLRNTDLPFVHFATRLSADMPASEIHARYLLLMKAAIASISEAGNLNSLDTVSIDHEGRATFSYNLAMTTGIMAILPRKEEACAIPGLPASFVAINGTILAGTLMVKAEDEWSSFCKHPEYLHRMFRDIAYLREDVVDRSQATVQPKA